MTASVPATFDTRQMPNMPPRGNRLISQAYYAKAPWQFITLVRLHDLSEADFLGPALVPSQSTLMFARMAIASLPDLNLPSPIVSPVSGGSIGLVWSVGTKQLEVVFDEDQLGAFVLSQGDHVIEDGDISLKSTDDLNRALNSLLRP